MAKINILHLTDIHIGHDFVYDKVQDLAYRISDELENLGNKIDVVLVSGDIFDGRASWEDREEDIICQAKVFFTTLLDRLKRISNETLTKDDFLFIPGNHDIKRHDDTDQFVIYRKFLSKFYGNEDKVYELYNKNYLYRVQVFEKQKIAILALNSCKVEKDESKPTDSSWMDKIDLSDIAGLEEEYIEAVQKKIKDVQVKEFEEKWYDFGYIELGQMIAAIDELKEKINQDSDYTIIASFHHHIHPFPEIYGKTGDVSLIKNFEIVIQKLQSLRVQLILHGHKHLPLVRPVANDKYIDDPGSLIYAVAGGNIGTKSLMDRYFQLVEVFNAESYSKIAKISRFQFKGEQAEL